MAVKLDMKVHGGPYHKERAPTEADARKHSLGVAGALPLGSMSGGDDLHAENNITVITVPMRLVCLLRHGTIKKLR